jgi:hypothetical protein
LRLSAFQCDPAEPLKTPPTNTSPRRERSEVTVMADKDRIVHLAYDRDQWVRRVWGELCSEQNDFVAGI